MMQRRRHAMVQSGARVQHVQASRCALVLATMMTAVMGATLLSNTAAALTEPDSLKAAVAAGDLPPIAARLPKNPKVMTVPAVGRHGGKLRTLFGRTKDIRLMTVYGYARLVRFNDTFELVPDILESIDVKDGRIFTLTLREGHRWSDGVPLTTEDFRYFWEDVAMNETLSPLGPGAPFILDGKLPKFEIVDARTVRFSWTKPNPYFLPALAAPRPPFLYRPSHYLKKFHARYQEADKLQELVEEKRQRDWRALHFKVDRPYRNDNIEYPTLQPWKNTTETPAQRFIFERNPYFHRVDQAGNQLPYIDEVIAVIASANLIPLKIGTGDADLQSRGMEFKDYTFAKRSAQRNDYDVRLWRSGKGSQISLFPNMNVRDPLLRKLMQDVRVRRALSVAINREEINQVIYFGLANTGGNTLLPTSPLFKPEYAKAWTQFDPALANRLLDEAGLTKRRGDGIRLRPDNGEPLFVIVETPGESDSQTDALQLISDHWRDVGLGLIIKPSRREVMRQRAKTGTTAMTIFAGLDNGLATSDFAPDEFVPTNEDQLQWPQWGRYIASNGQAGEAPDLPWVKDLVALRTAWIAAETDDARREAWHEILKITSDQVFAIGLISGVPQPVVVSNRLKNVPDVAYYNWDPGALFGVYSPDTFWFEAPKTD